MGVPMSRFSMLSKLISRGYAYDYEEDASQHYFEQFNLTAIVICNNDDSEFIEYMSQNFERLHSTTGKNLLFFCLARPGKETQANRMSICPAEAMMDTETYPVDEELYFYVLAEALKIPMGELPLILITDSLKKSCWYIINTSVKQIRGDLSAFTLLAAEPSFDFSKMIEAELDLMIDGAGRHWEKVESTIPLCTILSGIEASVATLSSDKEKSNKALETIRQTEKNLERIRDKEAHDLYFLLRCLRKAPRGWHRQHSSLPTELSISTSDLEQCTIGYLKVYDKILSLYSTNNLVEYSPLGSLTHKIFESELRASVLQLMRYYLRIPMPEYYNKWCDKRGTYFVSTSPDRRVYLNSHNNGNPKKYKSPTLGDTCYAFLTLCNEAEWKEECAKFGFTNEQLTEFADLWKKIFSIRNEECHCTPMSYEDYQNLTNSVNAVLTHFFDNMVKIKRFLNQ